MTQMNAIGWFDIFVDDMDRAVAFYETVFARTLDPIGDPTGRAR
jgi:predicted enzyme related to lactoylglutathione lyase